MIDIRIETFITLSQIKSYTKTAEKLCITQPAVTQHIKYLEGYYKQKLIVQDKGKLSLTLAGEKFLEYCLHIRSYSKQIEKVLEEIEYEEKTIQFGATLSIGGFLIPPILKRYIKEYPEVKIKMIIENTEHLMHKLIAGEIEFVLVEGYFNQAEFISQRLKKEPFILVASSQNDIAYTKNITLEDIKDEVLILREKGSGTREILEKAMYEANYTIKNFNNLIEIGSLEVIKEMVKHNIGISFMYQTVAEKELQEGTLVKVPVKEINLEKAFHFVHMPHTILEEEYKCFFGFIKNNLYNSYQES